MESTLSFDALERSHKGIWEELSSDGSFLARGEKIGGEKWVPKNNGLGGRFHVRPGTKRKMHQDIYVRPDRDAIVVKHAHIKVIWFRGPSSNPGRSIFIPSYYYLRLEFLSSSIRADLWNTSCCMGANTAAFINALLILAVLPSLSPSIFTVDLSLSRSTISIVDHRT